MRFLVTASLALGGAILVSSCGGGAGPATPFDPFGTDPSGSSSEPFGASNETPGGQSISALCTEVCGRFMATCPSTTQTNCAGSCAADAMQYPNCVPELQAFLVCANAAVITCSPSGSVAVESCLASESAVVNCLQISQGTTGSPA
jgi:hypothetical protein